MVFFFIERKNAEFRIQNNTVLTAIKIDSKEQYNNLVILPVDLKVKKRVDDFKKLAKREFEIIDAVGPIIAILGEFYIYNFKTKILKTYR